MTLRASSKHVLLPGARCAVHASRPATGVCNRCGDYLCGLCGRRVGDRLHCPGCAERLTREHSKRALRAFTLGLCGVHGLFFLSPIALVLALVELSAIRNGDAPVGGSGFARAAFVLGACGIVMPLAALLVFWLGRGGA